MDSILTESVISFGGAAAPITATGTRVPRDVMFSQVPGVAQPGSSTQSDMPVSCQRERQEKSLLPSLSVLY